ncbi:MULTISPECIES: TIGR00153 family protein [Corallincola]|uniref:TIGR00153 family protein n=3 Tax=Corallincola TaxID=1775176 RepID=A0A368NPX9_9GAMM|nr:MULTISPECIES: TIGR00153 family protein [Corallincola]RCU51734.1 TIGR00153 family protein [Corallincola holothuriorum]TAA47231.1 TIGR00153 family protein [Corallincola spongiicola]TCI04892.1 TIGR00153 family protein [Corallincola luteus]
MPLNNIMGVFAKSPIKPLEEHINKVHACSEELTKFFKVVLQQDWKAAAEIRLKISTLEKEADALKREIRLKLPSGLFMPVERTDMLELLTQQDKIANIVKDIAGRVLGREMVIPESIADDFEKYVARCIDATALAKKAINELDELLETGFRGREVDLVEKMIHELDLIEDDTDTMQIRLRKQLRSLESELNPVDVMFLYNIIEWVGAVADQAERVGARLELMLARS